MSGNTAIATTATANTIEPIAQPPEPRGYVGRFAPSPTGALHLGSLVAALGSFLETRRHDGQWLLRMEDLDRARVRAGCAAQMLRTLEAFGLQWDQRIVHQHEQLSDYAHALRELTAAGLTFECSCSRRELDTEGGYPGTCRDGARPRAPTALRFRVPSSRVSFEDALQGPCVYELGTLGDVILRRRDGTYAYQLAVVVDDARQGVTDVVRGADLLESTAWQICLQGALKLPAVSYAHLPLILEADGSKLAKSRRSVPLDPRQTGPALYQALQMLQQAPPPELKLERGPVVLAWARANWRPEVLRGVRAVRAG